MTPEQLASIEHALENTAVFFPDMAAEYETAGHSHYRYRWDSLWRSRNVEPVFRRLYAEGLTDTHIDTGLRSFLGSEYETETDPDPETDQDRFRAAIEHHCAGLDSVSVGCAGSFCEYADGDADHTCEASFSWASCDSCGSSLGGDRHPAQGCYQDPALGFQAIEMSICVDCVMLHANGETPESWR